MGASVMTDHVPRDIAVQKQGWTHGYDGQRKEVPAFARTLGGTLHGWGRIQPEAGPGASVSFGRLSMTTLTESVVTSPGPALARLSLTSCVP